MGIKNTPHPQFKRELLKVGCFWKNDLPTGLGIVIQLDEHATAADRKALEDEFSEHNLNTFVAPGIAELGSKDLLIKSMYEDLDNWGKLIGANQLDTNTKIIAAMMIAWLTLEKAMPNDNFNGSMFQWTLSK
jgi:hypothetical protein